MAETMIASRMTDGQIENLVAKVRDACRKHREELTSEAAQAALGVDNIGMRMFAVFHEQAETMSEMIVRRVLVNRSRKPQEAIDATGRVKYLNQEVVAEMPQCEGEEVEVCFFPLCRYTRVADMQKLLEEHGLTPDPYAVVAVNEADPSFADNHPNATQWVDDNGRHCYATFYRWYGGRRVLVDRNAFDWDDFWWVGGVRK